MQCIQRHDKSLSMPRVVFSSIVEWGGCYREPGRYEIEIDGHFIDGSKGIIEVSTEWPELMDATITHEWRHHWQRFNIGAFPEWLWTLTDAADYDQTIREYFSVWHEFDAFRFEYTYARNWSNDNWAGILGNIKL